MKGGNNKLFAQFLANFMKEQNIDNSQYALIAGYCVAQIVERNVTDLDVIVTEEAYKKLSLVLSKGTTEISKTSKLKLDTEYGEIEFFEREKHGFPSDEFSLDNLHKNNMLVNDEFDNPYLNREATINHYADVKKVFILGDKHEITKERLEKNISHLEKIYNVSPSNDLNEKINKLKSLIC